MSSLSQCPLDVKTHLTLWSCQPTVDDMTPTPSNPVDLDSLISFVESQHPDGDVFTRLTDAVNISESLGTTADALIGHYVEVARANGASWTEIGTCLGVSKQAAQQRHVARRDEDPDFPARRLFSRFTKRARNVVQEARRQADQRANPEVTNAHLVLGLVSEPDGLAGQAMVAAGASLEAVQDAILADLSKGAARKRKRRASFAADAKKTLELALREALRLDHNYIGTEHLLLGVLLSGGETTATLNRLGVTHDVTDAWLETALDELKKPLPGA
jgi:Clp amino terminal domain, pathogenicity island component